jgi:hypothetical protein
MGTLRGAVLNYLAEHGPVFDTTGHATAQLHQALGAPGSMTSFAQLIAQLGKQGLIQREVRGKRTYRIALQTLGSQPLSSRTPGDQGTEEQPAADPQALPPGGSHQPAEQSTALVPVPVSSLVRDPEEVAAALLALVTKVVAQHSTDTTPPWSKRRIEFLERKVNELETELMKTQAQLKEAQATILEKETELVHAHHNLSILQAQLTAVQRQGTERVLRRLGPAEREILARLQRRPAHAS